MTPPTPDNAASATPVAWVERTEGGLTRMWSGDLSAWAHRPANPEPLYSAATVTALEARVKELEKALSAARVVLEAEGARATLAIVDSALTGAGAK